MCVCILCESLFDILILDECDSFEASLDKFSLAADDVDDVIVGEDIGFDEHGGDLSDFLSERGDGFLDLFDVLILEVLSDFRLSVNVEVHDLEIDDLTKEAAFGDFVILIEFIAVGLDLLRELIG